MERRIAYLQRTQSIHGERIAKLETLEPAIARLSSSVEDLSEAINRGKGAIWIIGGLGGIVGVALSWIVNHLWGK